MRQKAYYTKDEITANLYTMGGEWMTTDDVEYKGLYHTYATGEIYTQGTWNQNTSVKLIPYERIDPAAKIFKQLTNIDVKYDSIQTYVVNVTEQNRLDGYISRYFIKKINETSITEIDSTQFNAWISGQIDNNVYVAVEIIWRITGNQTTQYVNGVQLPGVSESNLQRIQNAERVIPGISSKLSNPLEYYSDVTYNVPRDING
jgi:hypothetical protein